ncbi:phage head-tail adaptor, putative, SPP1 family [Parageobacillus thermantarcticus]|uniref:Phage head-tail adaptor, putative, SPP1 family n=1 Tax=Parageobacillus thermantarcticus TaxID=186116 RepID=A0A1I0TGU1_9BACL|nr:phage head-tail adaptor, putative, SPP1 family [Parageobacillus thermantarcticus]
MAVKPYRETFNDGFLSYGHKQTQRSATGKRIGEAFTEEGKLAFKEMSCRDQDYHMAGIMGASLDRKVKTLYPPSFRTINKNKLKVVIDNIEYDVITVDSDGMYLYFYLQEVGAINE